MFEPTFEFQGSFMTMYTRSCEPIIYELIYEIQGSCMSLHDHICERLDSYMTQYTSMTPQAHIYELIQDCPAQTLNPKP
jgi:hypothetical protein